MQPEEQEALLEMWKDFLVGRPLSGRAPSGALMRAFYFDVVSFSPHYRYGMAPELFDLLVNGAFRAGEGGLWAAACRAGGDDQAA